MAFTLIYGAILGVFLAAMVQAVEHHTIRFDNRCGFGTPTLVQGGKILSTGDDYTSNGAFTIGIAYLQTGHCLLNGEKCTLMEMTLRNPTAPGGGSSADISLIPPHSFSVPTSFSYFGGCDGVGATCSNEKCSSAFFKPEDTQTQVACQDDNVNLLITFCGEGTSASPPASSGQVANASPSAGTSFSSSVRPGRKTCGSRVRRSNSKAEWKHNLKDLTHRRLIRLHRRHQAEILPAKLSAPTPVFPLSLPLPFRLPRQQERLAATLQVQTAPATPCL